MAVSKVLRKEGFAPLPRRRDEERPKVLDPPPRIARMSGSCAWNPGRCEPSSVVYFSSFPGWSKWGSTRS